MKRVNVRKMLWLAMVAAVTLFIWSHSLLSAEDSIEQSNAVRGVLSGWLADSRLGQWILENIRTVAHFAEFALLGVAWGLRGSMTGSHDHPLPWLLLPGPLTAVADELLQLTSAGRAAQWVDLLVDSAGYLAGLVCIFLCTALFRRLKRCKNS